MLGRVRCESGLQGAPIRRWMDWRLEGVRAGGYAIGQLAGFNSASMRFMSG